MKHFLSLACAIASWRDCIEIVLISYALYAFMLWLRHDRHKNLLAYFYSYWAITCAAYALKLPMLSCVLCSSCPVFIMLFIVIHQISLQKNFVALRTEHAPIHANSEWVTTLMRTTLLAMNNNKEIRCIIQQRDTLDTLIEPGVWVHAGITHDLLAMLVESSSYNQDNMIWLRADGTLVSINARWNPILDEHWVSPESNDVHLWEHHALLVTSRNDAIAVRSNPHTQTCTIITQGTIKEQVPATTAIQYIQSYLQSAKNNKGDIIYATSDKKGATQQHNA